MNNEFIKFITRQGKPDIAKSLNCVLLKSTTHNKPEQGKGNRVSTKINIRKYSTNITIAEKFYKPISKMIG